MIQTLLRFLRWFEPLVTDVNQIDNKTRDASLPKLTAITLTSLFVRVVLYASHATKELPNLITVIDGLIVALVTIWGVVFAHKFVLPRSGKINMGVASIIEKACGDAGGKSDSDGSSDKPAAGDQQI